MHAAKRYWHAMEQRGNTKQELHGNRADHHTTQNYVPAAPCPYAKGTHRRKCQRGDPTVMELRRCWIFKRIKITSITIFYGQ